MIAWMCTLAAASETVDLPVFEAEGLKVVADRRYPKDDRTEFGVNLGWMPFDALVRTPNLQLHVTRHLSERSGLTFLVNGGYGLTTGVYRQLASPAYGVTPDVFRYLASFSWGIDYSPVYGKLNLNGGRVVHFDAYVAKRFGATLESSVEAGGGLAVGPTLTPAIGTRIFLSRSLALRFEVRDDLLIAVRLNEVRPTFTQNANLVLGLVGFTKGRPVDNAP